MSKLIKLQEPVYDRVTRLMRPKESYSQVIERMLNTFEKLGELRGILEFGVKPKESEREQHDRQTVYDVRANSP